MKVKIRQYKRKDEEVVKKCILALKEWESKFDSDCKTSRESVNELFEDLNPGKEGNAIYVAEYEGNVVGFVSFRRAFKNDLLVLKKVEVLHITDISVMPDFRGKGIGTYLIEKVKDYADKKGIKYLKLVVFSENQGAVRFYKRVGFESYEKIMLAKI